MCILLQLFHSAFDVKMVMCYVPDCKHYSERELCSFLRFPHDEKVKKKWLINIRRADKSPSISSRICSCHFKDKLKANGPTIFERNKNKLMMFESPEKKQTKKYGNLWQSSIPQSSLFSSTGTQTDLCELEDDMENYWQWKLIKDTHKSDVIPHIFHCQKTNMEPTVETAAEMRKHIALVKDALNDWSTTCDVNPAVISDYAVSDDLNIFVVSEDTHFERADQVCELLSKECDAEAEMSSVDPKTGKTLKDPLSRNHLNKNVVPSLNINSQKTSKSMQNRETPEQKRKRLEIAHLSQALQKSLKSVPGINSSLEDTCETSFSPNSSFSRQTVKDTKAKNKKEFKRRRKSNKEEISKSMDNSFSEPSFTQQSCNQNFIADCNNSNNSTISFQQIQITNVQSVISSENLNCVSSEKETNKKESCDSTFYKKPIKIEKRDESFGKFVACEMSELRVNPELYLKTKQSILKLLVKAQFEQMNSSNGE